MGRLRLAPTFKPERPSLSQCMKKRRLSEEIDEARLLHRAVHPKRPNLHQGQYNSATKKLENISVYDGLQKAVLLNNIRERLTSKDPKLVHNDQVYAADIFECFEYTGLPCQPNERPGSPLRQMERAQVTKPLAKIDSYSFPYPDVWDPALCSEQARTPPPREAYRPRPPTPKESWVPARRLLDHSLDFSALDTRPETGMFAMETGWVGAGDA